MYSYKQSTLLIISLLFSSLFSIAQQSKPLFVFDFELDQIPIPKRTSMLVDLGYSGVTFAMKNKDQIEKYKQYMATPEANAGQFSIPIVYFPYHFKNDPVKEDKLWKEVLKTPSLKSLWVVLVNRGSNATPEQGRELLGSMADAAEKLGKDIVIYPHDNCLIESVEEAIPYIQDLKRPNIYLSMHSCHELRAGNGDRMLEVAIKAAPYLKFVSIAGSDVTMYSEGIGAWGDAIKPLDEGDYDMTKFFSALHKIGYDDEVMLHTFGIKQDPKVHLKRSIEKWNEMHSEQVNENTSDITTILDAPESTFYDPATQSWFVSSLGGGKVTLEKDGYGWITRLDKNRKVISKRWIEGLDAPTGMSVFKNKLYVGDRGVLVEIDISKGEIIRRIPLPGAEFINDVAISPNGEVYISDTFKNRIYRMNLGGEIEVFLESNKLNFPNGLWLDEDQLIVATWGSITERTTFATSKKGTLLKVNLSTKEISPIGKGLPIANFDGVVKYGDYYYCTDWTGGRLLQISEAGEVTEIATGFNQFADLGIDTEKGIVVIPEMSKNRLILINLKVLKNP